jgi:hypothetical protein
LAAISRKSRLTSFKRDFQFFGIFYIGILRKMRSFVFFFTDASVHPQGPVMTSQEDFDDREAWGEIRAQTDSNDTDSCDEDSDDSDVTISEIFPTNTLTTTIVPQPLAQHNRTEHYPTSSPGNQNDVTSTPPTSALVSKLFPKLKQKPKVIA